MIEEKEILVINPGSTSTKIAVYRGKEQTIIRNIFHDPKEIHKFPNIASQMCFRKEAISKVLKEENYSLNNLSAVVGRGGMVIGLKGGGYLVNKKLCQEMERNDIPQHASSLGALIAFGISNELNLPAFIYDSPMGCELIDVAKITGINGIEKYGCCHVLNSRAQGIKYAEELGVPYEQLNLIVCHMGGGVTANAQSGGRIIDTAAYDDGPMAPERSGGVPLLLFKGVCFDSAHSEEDVESLISGKGGLYSYLGTTDCQEIQQRIKEGDDFAALVYRAMAYQIAKAIADMSVALKGRVDAIILTGGVAHSEVLTSMIREYAGHIGKFVVMAGENEMEALAMGALRMLDGKEDAKTL